MAIGTGMAGTVGESLRLFIPMEFLLLLYRRAIHLLSLPETRTSMVTGCISDKCLQGALL
jgi:hypothetical protein